jgi:hypothetical protein
METRVVTASAKFQRSLPGTAFALTPAISQAENRLFVQVAAMSKRYGIREDLFADCLWEGLLSPGIDKR